MLRLLWEFQKEFKKAGWFLICAQSEFQFVYVGCDSGKKNPKPSALFAVQRGLTMAATHHAKLKMANVANSMFYKHLFGCQPQNVAVSALLWLNLVSPCRCNNCTLFVLQFNWSRLSVNGYINTPISPCCTEYIALIDNKHQSNMQKIWLTSCSTRARSFWEWWHANISVWQKVFLRWSMVPQRPLAC